MADTSYTNTTRPRLTAEHTDPETKTGSDMIDAVERMRLWVESYVNAIDLGLTNDEAKAEANELLRVFDRTIQSEQEEELPQID